MKNGQRVIVVDEAKVKDINNEEFSFTRGEKYDMTVPHKRNGVVIVDGVSSFKCKKMRGISNIV